MWGKCLTTCSSGGKAPDCKTCHFLHLNTPGLSRRPRAALPTQAAGALKCTLVTTALPGCRWAWVVSLCTDRAQYVCDPHGQSPAPAEWPAEAQGPDTHPPSPFHCVSCPALVSTPAICQPCSYCHPLPCPVFVFISSDI